MNQREVLLLKRLRKRRMDLDISYPRASLVRKDGSFRFDFDLQENDLYTDLKIAIQFQIDQHIAKVGTSSVNSKKFSYSEVAYFIELQNIIKMLTNKRILEISNMNGKHDTAV